MRAFISHATEDLVWAQAAKRSLEVIDVGAFLAHEDTRIAQEWRNRLLQELTEADIFVAVLSRRFRKSAWCDQELGFALARPRGQCLVLGLVVDGAKPHGFLEAIQCQKVRSDADVSCFLEDALYLENPKLVVPKQIARLRAAGSPLAAERAIIPLVRYGKQLSCDDVQDLFAALLNTDHVWYSERSLGEWIPELASSCRTHLTAKQHEQLMWRTRASKRTDTWAA